MEPEKRFIEATKIFLQSWLYKYQRDIDLAKLADTEFYLHLRYSRDSELFEEVLSQFEDFALTLHRIKEALTTRTIDAAAAAEIHGLTNRQLAYWEKTNLMPFEKEKGKKRKYSVVDISYLLILRQLQEPFNSQPQAIAQIVRPILDEEILASCLIRDIYPKSSVCMIYQNEDELIVGSIGNDIQLQLKPKVITIVPMSDIVDNVLSRVGNVNVRSFVVEGKRYFNFPGTSDNLMIPKKIQYMFNTGLISGLDGLLRDFDNSLYNNLEESWSFIIKALQAPLIEAAEKGREQMMRSRYES